MSVITDRPASETARALHLARSRLALRRRRTVLHQWGLRLVAFGGLVVATLTVTFLGDFLFDLGEIARLSLVLGAALVLAWKGRERWWPVESHQNEMDLALLVEREQTISLPLVAALQFSGPAANDHASPQLKQAVIDQAEESAIGIDPLRGFSWRPLPWRAGIVVVGMLIVIGLAVQFPAHASTFGSRLLLRDRNYPTRTRIVSLRVQDRSIAWEETDQRPRPIRIPTGAMVQFDVQVAGVLPTRGAVTLSGQDGKAVRVELSRDAATPSRYSGRLESLDVPLSGTIQLGDARGPIIQLIPIPRPVVTTFLEVTPPTYARHNAPPAPAAGARNAAVLPGATIALSIHSPRKPLRDVAIELFDAELSAQPDGHPGDRLQRRPLMPSENRKHWRLDPAGTPLAEVDRAMNYRMIITDVDGLAPSRDVTGQIELRIDHPPRVKATASVRVVLPTARPRVQYSALDDFGVAAMHAHVTLRRSGEVVAEVKIPLSVEPGEKTRVSGKRSLEISEVHPRPGDEIAVVVEAIDDRGAHPGTSARAEAIVLKVTDRTGLLENLHESDKAAAELLEKIIQRELGIGGEE